MRRRGSTPNGVVLPPISGLTVFVQPKRGGDVL
jgi:hypothetical protein